MIETNISDSNVAKILANPFRFNRSEFDKLTTTNEVASEIVDGMTPEAITQLLGNCEDSGIEEFFDTLMDETYNIVYGDKVKIVTSSLFGHLDKVTDSIEESLRCADLSYFVTSVMPDFEVNAHHMDWFKIAQKYKRTAILASRDHGKSFCFSNAVPAWQMYRYKPITSKQRINNRGFLFSFSITQAVDLLTILKDNIESNEILRNRLYNKEKWGKTDITCKNRARLTVKGFGSSVRGAHPYWIIVDDGLKDNVIYSLEQRNKSINYFHSVIMNMITPNGQVIVVGTPFHGSDLYGDLKSKEGWKVFEYPGIYPDGSLLWENRWSFKGLMEKRASQGNLIFSREILCRPITSDSSIFPIEIMNNAIHRMSEVTLVKNRESYHMKFERVIVGVDFAISSSVGADYTVITVWGIDNMDRMWLMEAIMEKGLTYGQQIAILKNINVSFKPEVMILENNVFQQIYVQQSELEGLPVIGHTTGVQKNDLEKGWAGLALLFERGLIKIPTGDRRSRDFADALIMQFGSVAFTDKGGLQSTDGHDDICSSVWLASIGVKKVITGAFNFNFI